MSGTFRLQSAAFIAASLLVTTPLAAAPGHCAHDPAEHVNPVHEAPYIERITVIAEPESEPACPTAAEAQDEGQSPDAVCMFTPATEQESQNIDSTSPETSSNDRSDGTLARLARMAADLWSLMVSSVTVFDDSAQI